MIDRVGVHGPLLLARSTWPEIARYLESGDGVVVPTGSTEQHGRTGRIGTDALCAQAVAHAMSASCGALVAPTVAYAPAQFNLGFAGTVSLRPETMTALLVDCLASLVRHGFRHVYFINGHGANLGPIACAVQSVQGRLPGARLRCRVRSWWDYRSADALRKALYGAGEGMHATPSELSIAAHLHGELDGARDEPAAPRLADAWMRAHTGDAHDAAPDHRRRFPDGRVGSDSALARAEHGERLLGAAAGDAAADYLSFLEE